jgi:quinohemoprotein ethanol dehydrogenase
MAPHRITVWRHFRWESRPHLKRRRALLLGAVCGLLSACQQGSSPAGPGFVTGERIISADAEPGNWLSHGRTYDEQRYSPLDRINPETIDELGLAWSFDMGTTRGLEATPLVVDGIMYVTGTWSRVYALDAAGGNLIWSYDPEVPGATARNACCDVVNRGVALWDDRVYVGTLDGRLVALDAATGEPAWEVLTVDPDKPYTITGAPRVVNGMVIIGNGGAEMGVRGYFTAYDAGTGEEIWRFYTVPGDPEMPPEQPELETALATWSEDSLWEAGLGGTAWDSMAYDPYLNLLYVGTGNGSPWNREIRSPGGGDNLFLASILAIDPESGRLAWHYQTTPGESWDYTATQHIVLADLVIDDVLRKVLMQAPKNGFFYVLDRATGELLSADNYVPVTWASGVDLATGRPVETGADWSDGPTAVRPGPQGGHNWQPMSYSPLTGLVYVPVSLNAFTYVADRSFEMKQGAWNNGLDLPRTLDLLATEPGPTLGAPTRLLAWDPVRRQAAWQIDQTAFKMAGVLSTAGGLVFQGTGGEFVAYDAASGERLWATETGVGIMAPPVTYEVGGEQYIAVMAGLGGNALGVQPINIENDGRLLAWKLGGRASMPALRRRTLPEPAPVEFPASAADIESGRTSYLDYCAVCHGINAASGGVLPDLRYSGEDTHQNWMAIVLGGLQAKRGMAGFSDVLSAETAKNIQAYVLHEARKLRQSEKR